VLTRRVAVAVGPVVRVAARRREKLNRRIVKKLSKRLLEIIKHKETFKNSAALVWVNDEDCGDDIPKGAPCIGGEYDSYAGDATEIYTVWEWLHGYCYYEYPDPEWDPESGEWPTHKRRLTGARVVKLIRMTP
jgi:hypothetical protein